MEIRQLWTAPESGAPMEAREAVTAVRNGGLRGDRYYTGRGYYSPYDACQVTLVAEAALDHVRREFDIDLFDGRHRRNVVLAADVTDLLGTRFRVGEAVFEGTRPRPPCAHVEAVAEEPELRRALSEQRGGICADVVESGAVAVGDDLSIVERLDDPDALAAAIRDRHEDA